ncbi:MAG: TRAP transporter small permease [Rhodospirillaceae bacterium]|jgi:TRAP-type C4-dicarboxylate transport system permease small subunit
MPSGENRVARAADALTTLLAYAAGIVLMLLMVLTTADVAGRYFFNKPITGVFDLTHFAVLIMVFFSLAYCGIKGGHVAIEILYDKLPLPVARGLDKFINLVGAILFLVIAWRTAIQSIDVKDFGEASQLLLIPYHPFYYLVAFGCVLFAGVMIMRIFIPEDRHAAAPEDGE